MQRRCEAVDPQLPFAKFRTMDDVRGEAVATPRAQAMLLGTLAGLALLLAAVGLYGLVARSRRGADPRARHPDGAGRVVAAGGRVGGACRASLLAVVGVAVGGVAARLGASALRHLVWGVSVADPLTFAVAIGVVLAVAAIAALVPALRIVRLNPIKALRARRWAVYLMTHVASPAH